MGGNAVQAMSSAEIIPVQDDIKAQLERMLASKRFSTASNQTDFLALVVNRALKGKKSPESIIARALFPKFIKDESTDVRVTASNLRKALAKYYAREGREDLVIIALPEPPSDKSIKLPTGEAYTPVFSYNPNHAAAKEFKLGEFYRKRGLIADGEQAIKHFYRAYELAPNHVGAIVSMGEVMCEASYYLGPREDERTRYLAIASDLIEKALRMAPNSWRTHAAKGYLLMWRKDLTAAEAEFNVARSLDPISTESSSIFIQFLFRGGRSEEGSRVSKSYLDAHVDDVVAHAIYGMSLDGAGHLDEAEQVLKNALAMDKSCFVVHCGLALLYAKQGRAAEAAHHTQYLEHLGDQKTIELVQWSVSNRLARAKAISP
jgi:tetratricopeptide (TPR) repeat protein